MVHSTWPFSQRPWNLRPWGPELSPSSCLPWAQRQAHASLLYGVITWGMGWGQTKELRRQWESVGFTKYFLCLHLFLFVCICLLLNSTYLWLAVFQGEKYSVFRGESFHFGFQHKHFRICSPVLHSSSFKTEQHFLDAYPSQGGPWWDQEQTRAHWSSWVWSC